MCMWPVDQSIKMPMVSANYFTSISWWARVDDMQSRKEIINTSVTTCCVNQPSMPTARCTFLHRQYPSYFPMLLHHGRRFDSSDDDGILYQQTGLQAGRYYVVVPFLLFRVSLRRLYFISCESTAQIHSRRRGCWWNGTASSSSAASAASVLQIDLQYFSARRWPKELATCT